MVTSSTAGLLRQFTSVCARRHKSPTAARWLTSAATSEWKSLKEEHGLMRKIDTCLNVFLYMHREGKYKSENGFKAGYLAYLEKLMAEKLP
ncbi:hypothetical protein O6P43_014607 [Quillaja saponaria]|uniref:Uncharacterized protein n=1 Tax=Quillaja saponaria TaxID=32244 RepID=A0AAD7LXG9_QUISA|nr:hypothetical protein O6P43_014607 [Quillaja saponaria]